MSGRSSGALRVQRKEADRVRGVAFKIIVVQSFVRILAVRPSRRACSIARIPTRCDPWEGLGPYSTRRLVSRAMHHCKEERVRSSEAEEENFDHYWPQFNIFR